MDLECFCGGTLVADTIDLYLEDLTEPVEIEVTQCHSCGTDSYSEDQREHNAKVICEARSISSNVRDIDREAFEFMTEVKQRGMLIPDGYQDDVRKFMDDFKDTGKCRIYATVNSGRIRVTCADMYDAISVLLDHKQLEELKELLNGNQ